MQKALYSQNKYKYSDVFKYNIFIYHRQDGDTCKAILRCGDTQYKMRLRIISVDTPELSTQEGRDVRKRVQNNFDNVHATMYTIQKRTYDRFIADVFIWWKRFTALLIENDIWSKYREYGQRYIKYTVPWNETIESYSHHWKHYGYVGNNRRRKSEIHVHKGSVVRMEKWRATVLLDIWYNVTKLLKWRNTPPGTKIWDSGTFVRDTKPAYSQFYISKIL
jgi:uncharacterized protein (DUF4415 family)